MEVKEETATASNIPPRRYLSREEAAKWLGVSVETFMGFGVPYCDFGPRSRRWDLVDIIDYAEHNKTCDSARTSQTMRRRQQCESTNAKAHPTGGQLGTTRTVDATARALGLEIKT